MIAIKTLGIITRKYDFVASKKKADADKHILSIHLFFAPWKVLVSLRHVTSKRAELRALGDNFAPSPPPVWPKK